MKSIVGAMFALLILAGCAKTGSNNVTNAGALTPTASSGELALSLAFDPSPPKRGSETITITIHDAGGNAVKGAHVSVATYMPLMSMSGPTLAPQDNGDGTYSAIVNMNYQTKWVLDVDVTGGGKSGKAEFEQVVQ